jgi:hypothetical protein
MSSEVMQIVLMDRVRPRGPMLDVCPVPGCSMITMGGTCVEHDIPVKIVYPRGRPYPGKPASDAAPLRAVGVSRPAPPA